jgi:hypothetical protein
MKLATRSPQRGGGDEECNKFLGGKSEDMRALWKYRRKWNDNNKMDPKIEGCEIMNLIPLALDIVQWRAVVTTVMNFPVP